MNKENTKKEMKVTKFDKEQKPAKITAGEQQHIIYRVMCGNPTLLQIHGFSFVNRYRVHFDKNNNPILLKFYRESNSYQMVSEEAIASCLFGEYNEFASSVPFAQLPFIGLDVIRKGILAWMHQSNSQINKNILRKYPKQTRLLSEAGNCFQRLTYDPVKVKDLKTQAPLFYGMLSRMESNSEAFCQKIGSFYDPDAYRKQSLWLYGDSDGGKSAIQALIIKMFGGESNCVGMTPGLMSNTFFTEILVNKQLWIVREATSDFINSDSYKSLSGDDSTLINPKGKSMYSIDLKGHFIFATNQSPSIKNERALLRRVIPVHILPLREEDKLPDKILWERLEKEIPYIASYCIDQYMKVKGNGFIKFDDSALIEEIESNDWEKQALFDAHFKYDESAEGSSEKVDVSASMLVSIVDPHGNARTQKVKEFRKWLKERYNCNCNFMARKHGRSQRFITKIRQLTNSEKGINTYY